MELGENQQPTQPTDGTGIKPGPHWGEARALTAVPSWLLRPKNYLSQGIQLINSQLTSYHLVFLEGPFNL